VKIALISTYELGRQPFGLASPAGWLTRRGHEARCLDLSREAADEEAIRGAGLIGFYVPMHTAARLTLELMEPVRRMNPRAHVCVFGLYAPMNEQSFQRAGANSALGAEFEESLAKLADDIAGGHVVAGHLPFGNGANGKTLPRMKFERPERSTLPALRKYAHLMMPDGTHRITGYTEASRGCKHVCRHCPIVPVYGGQFRVVDADVVLEDIRQQVRAGAEHVTFGDPDFFNGVTHATRIVERVHEEFPELTYDATIKIEHLKKHRKYLAMLRETGCAFVTSAVESVDDAVLEKLEKGHTRSDFLEVLEECRKTGLGLQPTFVAFTPWTTVESYLDLLRTLAELDLTEAVAPIQLGIRLLIPLKSRLLELEEIREIVQPFDERALVYPWKHGDARMDALAEAVQDEVANAEKEKLSRREIFESVWKMAHEALGAPDAALQMPALRDRATIPYLNEPWYC